MWAGRPADSGVVIRRLAVALLVLLALPLVAIPCWIALQRSDLPSPGDADLLVSPAAPAPGRNGFEHFAAASESADLTESEIKRLDRIRRGEVRDPEWVEGLLARNQSALEQLERGVLAPEFHVPAALREPDRGCCEMWFGVQALVKLSGAHAVLTAEAERRDPVQRALLGLRAGRRVSGGQGVDLVMMMYASALQSIALFDLETVVRSTRISTERARALVGDLETLRWAPSDWERMWAVEYANTRSIIEAADVPGQIADVRASNSLWRLLPADYAWQRNRTLAGWADIYRGLQKGAGLDCRSAEASSKNHEELGWVRLVTSRNPLGNILTEIARPNFESFELKRCYAETRISMTQALVAVKAHADENGSLPETLSALVPEYLDHVPEDRFDGVPLRYLPERRTLYSVGEDFADRGGSQGSDPGNRVEPTLSLAF